MSDRPVGLDLRMPAGQTQGDLSGGMPDGASRQPADQEAMARFAQSLRSSEGVPVPAQASGGLPRTPFSLFGQSGRAPKSAPEGVSQRQLTGDRDPAGSVAVVWDRSLEEGVRRLMVSEDQRSLRMDLDANLFPGVAVEVFEDAGAWVAQFTCSESDSFDRLAAAADEMALRMATALERDALWRVIPEGVGERAQVEAFSSAPSGGIR